jgi:hypothetical protein
VTGTGSAATFPFRTCARCKARRTKGSAAPGGTCSTTCGATIRVTIAAALAINSGAFHVRNVLRQFTPPYVTSIAERPNRTGVSGQWHGYRYRTGGIRPAMNEPAACANRRAELHSNGSAPRHTAHRRHRAWQTHRQPAFARPREGGGLNQTGRSQIMIGRTVTVPCPSCALYGDTRRARRTRGAMRPTTR